MEVLFHIDSAYTLPLLLHFIISPPTRFHCVTLFLSPLTITRPDDGRDTSGPEAATHIHKAPIRYYAAPPCLWPPLHQRPRHAIFSFHFILLSLLYYIIEVWDFITYFRDDLISHERMIYDAAERSLIDEAYHAKEFA